MKEVSRIALSFFLFILQDQFLQAGPIPKLFNTGVDDNKSILGAGVVDPHYRIIVSADPDFGPGPNAYTLLPGYPVGAPRWMDEGPSSRWIAPQANQNYPNNGVNKPGLYTYQTTFDLTGLDPATAHITMNLAADDDILALRLNSIDLGVNGVNGFDRYSTIEIPLGSAFITGTNALEFDVTNGGTEPNPTGLRVDMTSRVVIPNEPPSVLQQPLSQTVIVGDLVNFAVEADGAPPVTYQWRFKGNPISGATDATYTIMGATTNNAGDYTVVISNSFGQITSGPATLTVLVPFPGIYNTGISDNRVVLDDDLLDPHYRLVLNANDSTSSDAFVEDASVGSLISGRWIPNSSKSKWIGPLPDTTSTASGNYSYQLALNLTGLDPATAFIAGSWATDDSGSVFLNGVDTGFKSTSASTFSTFTITNGFVSGTNLLEFRVNNAASGNTGLRVENLRGTAQPQTTTNIPPSIVKQPQGTTNLVGTSATFVVVADGSAPLNYQWYKGTNALTDKTSATLTISPLIVTDAGSYSVEVTNPFGTATSSTVQLGVYQTELGIFNTGVDTYGALLPLGAIDPHYALIASADSTYPGPLTYALSGVPTAWLANGPDSEWISVRPSGRGSALAGQYTFRLMFNLQANDVATASISGSSANDDEFLDVLLNGNSLGINTWGFTAYKDLIIPAGSPFIAGTNTLDFVVNNGADGPIGLRLDNMVLAGVTITIHLTINSSNGTISISWDQAGTLQSADQVTGPYNTVPGVNGNSFQAQANASKQKFYRVSSPQN